jgi:hypothetical protein
MTCRRMIPPSLMLRSSRGVNVIAELTASDGFASVGVIDVPVRALSGIW